MREMNDTVEVVVRQTQSLTIAYADFTFVTESKMNCTISGEIGYFSADDKQLGCKSFLIDGQYYTLLMSDRPPFAPYKRANEYRESDLWYILDLIDQQQA